VTVERTYGPLRSLGGPLLLVIGLFGTGGLAYARREHDLALTPAERDYLSYSDDRAEFAEWITTFRLPPSVHERPEAEAEQLRDLVDFAIDNDIGVVEDPETGAYHAIAGEYVYTYRPPSLSAVGSPEDVPVGDEPDREVPSDGDTAEARGADDDSGGDATHRD
jgi:hypothetical protein